MSATAAPRTLTQMLRDLDQAALVRLLRERPDAVADPPPTDYPQVAARITERQSVIDAVGRLHAFDAWVVRQACRLDGLVTPDAVAALGSTTADAAAALERLRGQALMWGAPDGLRPVRALAAMYADAEEETAPSPGATALDDQPTVSPATVDKVGAGSAFEALQRVEVLVEHSDHAPMTLTRDDEPTRKSVRAVAGRLEMPMGPTTTLIEICRSARLLGSVARGNGHVLLPTEEFDAWESAPLGAQWEHVVTAWTTHHAASGAAWLKALCLEAFGDRGSGRVLDHDAVKAWLAWWRPQRPVGADRQAGVFLETAAMLGVTGCGALTTYAYDRDVAALESLLPERIDHVVVQADMTAVAPGPLSAEASHELGQLADLESRGGATVYRFSAESLRRAAQLGWTDDAMLEVLARRSSTPLPQPLTYLVGDAVRQVSTGSASVATEQTVAERAPTPEVEAVDDTGDDAAIDQVVQSLLEPEDSTDDQPTAKASSGAIAGDTLSVLREAVETGEVVWIGFVDATGATRERLVKVRSVDDGELHSVDTRSGDGSRLPVHRITAAHILRTS